MAGITFSPQSVDDDGKWFATWTPEPLRLRLTDATAGLTVRLENDGAADGGKIEFGTAPDAMAGQTMEVDLPADGSEVTILAAGAFGHPSKSFGDATVVAIDVDSGTEIGRIDLMVRVRRNADKLSDAERDRFLVAMAILNDAGAGPFRDVRDTHTRESSGEAHGGPAFLPWHRAYLLDLERQLQEIDPEVALPYWRFDEAAPALLSPDFLGNAPATGNNFVRLSPGHPLTFWQTDGQIGMFRGMPLFAPNQAPPRSRFGQGWVLSEAQTIGLGQDYRRFSSSMEGAPHGTAHVSFRGPIDRVPTAARDPLFFLLHCNVDRLWAKWQWFLGRFDPDDLLSFQPANRIGHRLDDTMWPWNGDTGPPRPSTAPGGQFPQSPVGAAPGVTPSLRDMIDFQSVKGAASLGFCYDDVPFEVSAP